MVAQSAKRLLNSYLNWKYHSSHKKTAHRILNEIESVKGRTNPKLIKLSNEYASDILGWVGFSPWLQVYSAINQTFKAGWIPDNYYGKIVIPKLNGNYGLISFNQSLTSLLFQSPNFPDCIYFVNGIWISTGYQVLSENEVEKNIFNKSEKFVYKIDNSHQGEGIFILEKNNFNSQKLKSLGNGVLQKYINQHSFFDDIMPNSVATIRITSIVNDIGVISVRACYLRVGRRSDTHVKSTSHIRIPINFTTGKLYKYGYTTNWIQTDNHPDTNFIFENKQIPNFNQCIEVAINLHEKVPFTRNIGWDMVIDNDNKVQIMEWNANHNDIKFSEAIQGPCFSDLGWEKLWKQFKTVP